MRTRILLSITAILIACAGVLAYQKRGELFLRLYEQQRSNRSATTISMPPVAPVAIVDVDVITMSSEIVLRDQTVLLRDGLVQAIGPAEAVHVSEDYQVIDGQGRYLIPGLADMHVHFAGNALAMQLFIVNGVTSVRDMNGDATVLKWASQVEAGEILGPRIHATGPILDGRANDHSGSPVTTPEAARTRVLEQYAAGFRSIKPYTWLSREVYLAVAETAKSQGMYIVGHIPYSVGVDGAVAANQDEIAHIHSFHQDFFVDFDPNEVFREYELDLSRTLPIAAKLRDAEVRVTTTLIVNQALADAQDLDVYLERPMQDFEFSWARPYMDSPSWRFNKLWKRHYLEQEYLPWIYALLKTFNDFGVMLVLGTDSGVTGLVHGFSTHEELKLLVKAGLSPYEALRTATFNAARIANEESRWGTIETGKVADLVLLKENPLDDIANSRSIAGVVKSGRWFDEATLNSLKEQIRVAVN